MRQALLAVLILASGCATVPGAEEEPYRALGTEPFWSVTVANGRMTYEAPEGGFSVPAPRGQELGDGRIWETRRITLQASNAQCSDGMSDRRYAQTVRAEVDGRTLAGCGGEILAPATLDETSWTIVAISGEDVAGDIYHLRFGADRLNGQAGCNRFSGPYSVAGDRLTAGPLMSTRMACPEPRMGHERAALRMLAGPATIGHPDGDTMVLTGNGGTMRLRRVH